MTHDTQTGTKLYQAVSVIDDWPHRGARYNGVKVTWLVWKRDYDPNFNYSTLLDRPLPAGEDYSYERGNVDDLFTKTEADQLSEYLRTAHDTEVEVTEQTLPINGGYMPLSAIPAGGDCDFYMLDKHGDYNLPFQVYGYYNLEDQHPVKVLECGHECKHHQRIDVWVDPPQWMISAPTWSDPWFEFVKSSSPF